MDPEILKKLAIAAHGEAWRLLEKADRTEAETAAMIGAAHKSHQLWKEVGAFREDQRGNWLAAASTSMRGSPSRRWNSPAGRWN